MEMTIFLLPLYPMKHLENMKMCVVVFRTYQKHKQFWGMNRVGHSMKV